MEALNNILNTIISKGEITYRQINYLIRESNRRGKTFLLNYVIIILNYVQKTAKKELKYLKKERNIAKLGYREIDIISNSGRK